MKYTNSDSDKTENLVGSSNCKSILKIEVPDDAVPDDPVLDTCL